MVFLTALVGLPLSTLMAVGDPPGWQLELGQVELQGSKASLIFFVAYLSSFEVLRRCMRIRLVDTHRRLRAAKFLRRPSGLLLIAIPIAVVVVWLGI